MGRLARKREAAAATRVPFRIEGEPQRIASAQHAGVYLTDEATLFYVAETVSDDAGGEVFVELEDCGTLDLFLLPARRLAGRGLRTVTPAPLTRS